MKSLTEIMEDGISGFDFVVNDTVESNMITAIGKGYTVDAVQKYLVDKVIVLCNSRYMDMTLRKKIVLALTAYWNDLPEKEKLKFGQDKQVQSKTKDYANSLVTQNVKVAIQRGVSDEQLFENGMLYWIDVNMYDWPDFHEDFFEIVFKDFMVISGDVSASLVEHYEWMDGNKMRSFIKDVRESIS